jgi:hypothetical protein
VGKRDRKTGTQLIKKKSQETELVVHLTSRKHKRKCHGLGKKNKTEGITEKRYTP